MVGTQPDSYLHHRDLVPTEKLMAILSDGAAEGLKQLDNELSSRSSGIAGLRKALG